MDGGSVGGICRKKGHRRTRVELCEAGRSEVKGRRRPVATGAASPAVTALQEPRARPRASSSVAVGLPELGRLPRRRGRLRVRERGRRPSDRLVVPDPERERLGSVREARSQVPVSRLEPAALVLVGLDARLERGCSPPRAAPAGGHRRRHVREVAILRLQCRACDPSAGRSPSAGSGSGGGIRRARCAEPAGSRGRATPATSGSMTLVRRGDAGHPFRLLSGMTEPGRPRTWHDPFAPGAGTGRQGCRSGHSGQFPTGFRPGGQARDGSAAEQAGEGSDQARGRASSWKS